MGKRRWTRMTPEVRREVLRAAAKGFSGREIAKQVNVCAPSVWTVLRPLGGVIRGDMLERRDDRHLSMAERVEILVGLGQGLSLRAIAAGLDRAPSTIGGEVNRNGGRLGYRPVAAQQASQCRA